MGSSCSNDSKAEEEKILTPISDGKLDGADCLETTLNNLQKTCSEVANCFRVNKKYILEDPGMKELAREWIEISYETSKFLLQLSDSLRKEKARQSLLEAVLQNTKPGMSLSNELLHKLNEFGNEDPLEGFKSQFEPLVDRHRKMQGKLKAKLEELNKSWTPSKLMWYVLKTFSLAMTAVVVLCKAAEKLLAPEAGMYLNKLSKGIEASNKTIVYHIRNYVMVVGVKKMIESTDLTINKLRQASDKMEFVNSYKTIIDLYADNMKIAFSPRMLQDTKTEQEKLMRQLDGLCVYADKYVEELHQQREDLIWV